jgi:hypothetical protein
MPVIDTATAVTDFVKLWPTPLNVLILFYISIID